MPAISEWLLRLPIIRAELEALEAPVVDRSTIERIFGLRRRRAIQLMHRFGGYQAGRTFLLDRHELLCKLDQLIDSPDFRQEHRKKRQISGLLDDAPRCRAAHEIKIPVADGAYDRMVSDLPAGITLRAGRLSIEFAGVEDLLSKLYALARAAANDFDQFSRAVRQTN